MTTSDITLGDIGSVDYRRAAVLLREWTADAPNPSIVRGVLLEVRDDQRITHMIAALCTVTAVAAPELCEPAGRERLETLLERFAGDEAAEAAARHFGEETP